MPHITSGPRAGEPFHVEPIELFSGTIVGDTKGRTVEVGGMRVLRLLLDAQGEGAALSVIVEGSQDGREWFTLGAFAPLTRTGVDRKAMFPARFVRVASTIARQADPDTRGRFGKRAIASRPTDAPPTFTIKVSGEAA